MVISPLLRGMFGLKFDATTRMLTFAPHVPADWNEFAIRQIAAAGDSLDLNFSRSADSITLTAERQGSSELRVNFSPALSLRAEVLGATLNGKPLALHLEPHATDQHLVVEASLIAGTNTLKIRLRNDFSVTVANHLPALGEASQGLRILSQSWNASHDTFTLETEGLPGKTYTLSVSGKEQLKSADGARLGSGATLVESFPPSDAAAQPQKQTITLHFVSGSPAKHAKSEKSRN